MEKSRNDLWWELDEAVSNYWVGHPTDIWYDKKRNMLRCSVCVFAYGCENVDEEIEKSVKPKVSKLGWKILKVSKCSKLYELDYKRVYLGKEVS